MASTGFTDHRTTNPTDISTTEVTLGIYSGLFGNVPPYHVAMCRLFMDLDGHRLKRGLKVVASSNYPLFKHKFDIEKIMLPKGKPPVM